jgi:hypothetical protein
MPQMRKMSKQKRRKQIKPAQRRQPAFSDRQTPSAPTMFRFIVVNEETRDLMAKKLEKLKPLLWPRDGKNVRQMRQAATVEELLDAIPQATGLADFAWQKRMRQFGPEAVPLLAARLKTIRQSGNEDERSAIAEKLIGALRWQGVAGGEALLDCFDSLDMYGQALASVVLGLLNVQSSADKIWAFYQRAVRHRQETHFIGALWGLIDLQDKRAAGALAELLRKQQYFNEIFGFVSLAGDAQAIVPLLAAAEKLPESRQLDPTIAMISVAHRIGREALIAELKKITVPGTSDADWDSAADAILSKPVSYAEDHFEMFYRNLTAVDFNRR